MDFMIPRIIFQTWKTHKIPQKWMAWHKSWTDMNPDYEIVIQDDAENRQLVKNHFPEYLEFYDHFAAEIYRADLVRYFFLYHYGGIYADLDFECLRPFDSLLEKYAGKEIIVGNCEKDFIDIPNALMISAPGCRFWLDVVDRIMRTFKTPRGDEDPWTMHKCSPHLATGPVPLTETYLEMKDPGKVAITEQYIFYHLTSKKLKPLIYTRRKGTFYKQLRREEAIRIGAYAITYWTGSWSQSWKKAWRDKCNSQG